MVVFRLICAALVLIALPHASLAQFNIDQILQRGMDMLEKQITPPPQNAPEPAPAPAPAPAPPPQSPDPPAAAAPPADPQPTRDQMVAQTPPTSDRARIAEIQTLLNRLGYDAGAVDGASGPRTRRAIMAFQRANGLAPTGEPDGDLLVALQTAAKGTPAPAPQQGLTTSQALMPLSPRERAEAQTLLKQLGYYAGSADGRVNQDMYVAMVAFRKDHALPPGSEDQQLLQALRNVAAGAPAKPSPTPVEITQDFDPLAPEGIVPGMQIAVAGESLEQRGYRRDGYRYIAKSGVTEVLIVLHPVGTTSNEALNTIRRVDYQRSERMTTASAVVIANRISAGLGVQPHCNKLQKYIGNCVWNAPEGSSNISYVELRFKQNSQDTDIFVGISSAEASAHLVPSVAPTPAAVAPGAVTLATELDPLAPAGVSVGMEAGDAVHALAAAGFDEQSDGSFFRKEGAFLQTVRMHTGNFAPVSRGGPITSIQYRREDGDTTLSAPDLIEALGAKVGALPICSALKQNIAVCHWQDLAQAPLVQDIHVTYKQDVRGSETQLDLWPTDSLMKTTLSPQRAPAPVLADLDPLAPDGVAIGMKADDVGRLLAEKGYESRGFCDHLKEGAGRRLMRFKTPTECANQEPVSAIDYQADDIQIEGSLEQFLDRMNESVGAVGECQYMAEDALDCTWHMPARAPLVQKAVLRATKASVQVLLQAVPDMQARTMPPVPMNSQPWWVQELAQAEAREEKFSDSNTYALLSHEEQKRFGGEAAYVYDYCKGRETFAYLHDCRCVAGKVIDARVEQEVKLLETPALVSSMGPRTLDNNEFRTRLISIGDDVADQCPSKPGAAAYAFKQCRELYAASMAEGLDEFCTCYADEFAGGYMREPRSYSPHLSKLGSAALEQCQRTHIGPSRL